MPHRHTPPAALALSLLAACATTAPDQALPPDAPSDLLLATLFVNASAEYDATCHTVYAAATERLESIVRSRPPGGRPAAVVLDVDETVLDNSPYEVRLVETGTGYPEGWDEWCNEAVAEPVPGVSEFIARARALDVEVFFVTNRKAHLEEGTRRNLALHGLLEDRDADVVLMRGEVPEWTRDKTTRRQHVERTHDLALLAGDNVGDFYAFAKEEPTNPERAASIAARAAHWGNDWFMLPNPMYGGWDEAAVGYNYKQKATVLRKLRLGDMNAAR